MFMSRVVIEIDGVRHVLRHNSGFVCGRSCSLFDVCNYFDDYLCKLATAANGVDESDMGGGLGYYFDVESDPSSSH